MVSLILIVFMLLMNSCESNNVVHETKYVHVYPQLYFPELKDPTDICLPLDADYKVIRSLLDEQGIEREVVWVMMPYWYYLQMADYKTDVRRAKAEYESFIGHLPSDNIIRTEKPSERGILTRPHSSCEN